MTADESPLGYPQPIWQRFREAPHAGSWPDDTEGVETALVDTRAASSRLRLQLRWQDGHVREARFQAYGCPTSIAVGSYVADWCLGRTRPELADLHASGIRKALEIPDDRTHCALMGEDVLKAFARP